MTAWFVFGCTTTCLFRRVPRRICGARRGADTRVCSAETSEGPASGRLGALSPALDNAPSSARIVLAIGCDSLSCSLEWQDSLKHQRTDLKKRRDESRRCRHECPRHVQ